MVRPTTFLVAVAALLGACENRPQSEFHLLRSTAANAHFVDFSDVRTDSAGIRRVTLISVTRSPFATPDGELAQYGHSRLAFDCPEQRYRGEGMTVYAPDFTEVDEVREISPWRQITDSRDLQEDFRRFCASSPARSDLERLAGPGWDDAAKAALGRIAQAS